MKRLNKVLVALCSICALVACLCIPASAQFVSGTGSADLPARFAYALPWRLEYVRSSNDDSQAPALGGTLNTYSQTDRWEYGSSGSTNTVGGGYGRYNQTSYTWTVENIGLARLSFPVLNVDAMAYADYMPSVIVNPDSLAGGTPSQFKLYLLVSYSATYETGFIKNFTANFSRNLTANNNRIDLQTLWEEALLDATEHNDLQGELLSLAISFTFEPAERVLASDTSDLRGHTTIGFTVDNDNSDPVSEADLQALTGTRVYTREVAVLDDNSNWFEWLVDSMAGLMNTPLFGENFTLGLLLAVPLIALVVLGFLRLFAGG